MLPRPVERTDLGEVDDAEYGSEYWIELVRQQLRERFGTGAETQGLRVYTTYDPALQRSAYEAVTGTLDVADGPVGSLVAVDNSGRIRAMVAGTDFENNKVNLALGRDGGGSGRQPGSTFKPFALAAFVEQGYSTETLYRSPPTTQFPGVFTEPGELWSPQNFEETDQGILTVEEATWKSSNTVYAGIVNLVTPQRLAEMATRLGVRSELSPDYSLVLGTNEVSVLDMASAFSTFPARGLHVDPYVIRRVESADGEVLYDAATERQADQVISEEVADTVNSVLSGVLDEGTGAAAGLGRTAAGKTGTTSDARDAWFVGYSCELTAAVWMGYEQPRPMDTVPWGRGHRRVVPGTDLAGLHERCRGRRAPVRVPRDRRGGAAGQRVPRVGPHDDDDVVGAAVDHHDRRPVVDHHLRGADDHGTHDDGGADDHHGADHGADDDRRSPRGRRSGLRGLAPTARVSYSRHDGRQPQGAGPSRRPRWLDPPQRPFRRSVPARSVTARSRS